MRGRNLTNLIKSNKIEIMNDNLDNKDNVQAAEQEQPVESMEQECEADDEQVRQMERRLTRMKWLERAMLCVVVGVGLSMVGWLLCGRWLQAVNNGLWLFIAWMFWRQQTAFKGAARVMVYLAKYAANKESMLRNQTRISELQAEQIKNYEEIVSISKQTEEKQNAIIEKQDALIKNLERQLEAKKQKED